MSERERERKKQANIAKEKSCLSGTVGVVVVVVFVVFSSFRVVSVFMLFMLVASEQVAGP